MSEKCTAIDPSTHRGRKCLLKYACVQWQMCASQGVVTSVCNLKTWRRAVLGNSTATLSRCFWVVICITFVFGFFFGSVAAMSQQMKCCFLTTAFSSCSWLAGEQSAFSSTLALLWAAVRQWSRSSSKQPRHSARRSCVLRANVCNAHNIWVLFPAQTQMFHVISDTSHPFSCTGVDADDPLMLCSTL